MCLGIMLYPSKTFLGTSWTG